MDLDSEVFLYHRAEVVDNHIIEAFCDVFLIIIYRYVGRLQVLNIL